MQPNHSMPAATWAGLLIALFGVPLVIALFNQFGPQESLTNTSVILRELSVFAATGLLLLLVVRWEKLGLDSIGLYSREWGKSILWGLLGLLIAAAAIALTLLVLHVAGIQYGSGAEAARYKNISLWTWTLIVVRAGIVEEVCYRGYVIERLQKLSGNWLVYFVFPLVLFGLFHYRQGLGGILIASVAGAVLALLYLKRRDLKANIITHFLVDFIPNVLLPALSLLFGGK